jgi:membrane protease YdiL (CAAX protease family)
MMLVQATLYSVLIVDRALQTAEEPPPGVILVSGATMEWLHWAGTHRENQSASELSEESTYRWRAQLQEGLEEIARSERARDPSKQAAEWLRHFDEFGEPGFRERRRIELFPSGESWAQATRRRNAIASLTGSIVLAFAVSWFFRATSAFRSLRLGDAHLDFLFTFPVSARGIFAAEWIMYSITSGGIWLLATPLFTTLFWSVGLGWWGIPIAIAVAAYFAALCGALVLLAESLLRRYVSPARIAIVEVICVTAGSLAFMALVLSSGSGNDVFVATMRRFGSVLVWVPSSWPLLPLNGFPIVAALAMCACMAATLAITTIVYSERTTAAGLSRGQASGSRRAQSWSWPRFGGPVVQKEIRLFLRDPTLLSQGIIVPTIYIALQAWFMKDLLSGFAMSLQTAGAVAFGVGAFAMMTGAESALVSEGAAAWLLWTLPVSLVDILKRKAVSWMSVGTAFWLVCLAWTTFSNPSFELATLTVYSAVALWVVCMTATALGALSTDLLDPSPKRRRSVGAVYLGLAIVSAYAAAIYLPSWWNKVALLVLSTSFAYALWQKLADHAPYLLDPTSAPPPALSLSDGLMAALIFFIWQGALFLVLAHAGLGVVSALVIAFFAGGVLTALGSIYSLKKAGHTDVLGAIGLRRSAGASGLVPAVLAGIGAGFATAAVAIGYGWVLEHVDFFRRLHDDMNAPTPPPEVAKWLPVLAVVGAPMFEEIVFRGLVQGGLRRSLPPALAIVCASALFALVHPPVAAFPVFCFALFAGTLYEKTKRLPASMAAHATYNAIVLYAIDR